MHKPWGHYRVLATNGFYTLKRLFIKPGCRLSYQSHKNRIEHWYISGNAEVIIDDKKIIVDGYSEIVIKKNQKHRISNIGKDILTVYEVWIGNSDEADIIRHEDDYGREIECKA